MSSSRIRISHNQQIEIYRKHISVKEAMVKAVKENNVAGLQNILANECWPLSYASLDYNLLVTAITLGHKEITNILLDNGSRVFLKPNSNTPLHLAATKSNDWLDVMERLVQKGARVDQKNIKTCTPLHVAFTEQPSDEKTDLLLRCHLRQSTDNVINVNGLSFLHIACSRPHVEFVRKIVEANKDSVNIPIIQSKIIPLHFAVEYGRHEIAEFLVKNGADINYQNFKGSTPLHLSLSRRDIRMIDILFTHYKDRKNVINKFNLTHFMVACVGSRLDIVKEFLDMPNSEDFLRAKINSLSTCSDYTCLHLAADMGNTEVIEFLLDRGADCCALAIDNKTPHTIADQRNFKEMKAVLLEHCALRKRCKKLRAESPDFQKYGKDYEESILIERTRNLKSHRRTLKKLKHLNLKTASIFLNEHIGIENL